MTKPNKIRLLAAIALLVVLASTAFSVFLTLGYQRIADETLPGLPESYDDPWGDDPEYLLPYLKSMAELLQALRFSAGVVYREFVLSPDLFAIICFLLVIRVARGSKPSLSTVSIICVSALLASALVSGIALLTLDLSARHAREIVDATVGAHAADHLSLDTLCRDQSRLFLRALLAARIANLVRISAASIVSVFSIYLLFAAGKQNTHRPQGLTTR